MILSQLTVSSACISTLKRFMKKLKQRKGYYFNDHYMHEQVNLEDIYIFDKEYRSLDKLVKLMNSIKVYNDLDFWSDYNEKSISISDKIVFRLKIHYYDYNIFNTKLLIYTCLYKNKISF